MNRRIKLALSHAFYVAGLAFFANMSSAYIDQILELPEVQFCFISSFIVFGMAFFGSMTLQAKNGVNGTGAQTVKRKGLCYTNPLNHERRQKLWKGLFNIAHSPICAL